MLAAEFVCFSALPWLQARPPRTLEPTTARATTARRLNIAVLNHGSTQANTIPSGHAAGARRRRYLASSIVELCDATHSHRPSRRTNVSVHRTLTVNGSSPDRPSAANRPVTMATSP